jgi:hypothetical protein
MPYNTAPRCPEPPENHAGRTTRERKWKHALAYVSQLWRPSNTLEQTHATVSRYAMHLIDLTTGAAYTVQQLLSATASIAWASITGKPTTLAGFGITDAASSTHTHSLADVSGAGPAAITRTAGQGSPISISVAISGGGYTGTVVNRTSDIYNTKTLYSSGIFRVEWTGTQWRFLANGVEVDTAEGDTAIPSDASWSTITVTSNHVAVAAPGQACIVGASDIYIGAQVSPAIWLGPIN